MLQNVRMCVTVKYRTCTAMAASVSITVRMGGIEGKTWCSISPTIPDVILLPLVLEPAVKHIVLMS